MKWASAAVEAGSLQAGLASAAVEVQRQLGGGAADLTLVFVSPRFEASYPEVPRQLQENLPSRCVVGCSAEGVIGGALELEQKAAVAIVAARLPGVRVCPFYSDTLGLPDEDASPEAWKSYLGMGCERPAGLVLLADPFTAAMESVLPGLDYAFPEAVKIGGLVSGGRASGRNVLFVNDQYHRAGLAGVALEGNVAVHALVAQGCRPIGAPAYVTSCDQNLLLAIDDKPPLEYLSHLLGELSDADQELVRTSLLIGIRMEDMTASRPDDEFLVRNLVGVDHESGAIAVGAMLHEGQVVQFHLRDRATSAADLDRTLSIHVASESADTIRGALLFSCLGRGEHLYGAPGHDSGVFRGHLGETPLGGCFCNGEIGPVGATTSLHGYTSAFAVFREGADSPPPPGVGKDERAL